MATRGNSDKKLPGAGRLRRRGAAFRRGVRLRSDTLPRLATRFRSGGRSRRDALSRCDGRPRRDALSRLRTGSRSRSGVRLTRSRSRTGSRRDALSRTGSRRDALSRFRTGSRFRSRRDALSRTGSRLDTRSPDACPRLVRLSETRLRGTRSFLAGIGRNSFTINGPRRTALFSALYAPPRQNTSKILFL